MAYYTMHISRIALERILVSPFLLYSKTFSSGSLIGIHLKDKENAEQAWITII
jgi:hypothetical protein